MMMSPPIRPWFNKLNKIPDYITLPTFFHLSKQEPHKLDVKRENAINAEQARLNRERVRLNQSVQNIASTAASNADVALAID